MTEIYDIAAIINYAISGGYDIAPDRMEWVKLCHALKLLGFDETYFVALSQCHGTPSNVARRKWREEKVYRRFLSENTAPGLIVNLAKAAGIDVKRFFVNKLEPMNPRRTYRVAPTPPPMMHTQAAEHKPTPEYVAEEQVAAAARHYRETSLYLWLCKEFEPGEVDEVFSAYRVGASKFISEQGGRAVSFPYIDVAGRCVDCKIFHINPNTGSRKTAPPVKRWDGGELRSTWALAELKRKEHRAEWCNFGDHLLKGREGAPLGVVESEKTALILSLAYPDILWIAVGSKNNLTPKRFEPYRGRKVTVYPDRDGYNDKPRKDGKGIEKGWRTIAADLAAHGFSLSIDTTTERHPGESNDDLADIVLRWRHGKQKPPTPSKGVANSDTPKVSPQKAEAIKAFEEMKQRYPALAEFAEKFDLEPISVEPHRCQNQDEK